MPDAGIEARAAAHASEKGAPAARLGASCSRTYSVGLTLANVTHAPDGFVALPGGALPNPLPIGLGGLLGARPRNAETPD